LIISGPEEANIKRKNGCALENSAVIGHLHEKAKSPLKSNKNQNRRATKMYKRNNLVHEAYNTIALYAWVSEQSDFLFFFI
jgi:hypothetical protein